MLLIMLFDDLKWKVEFQRLIRVRLKGRLNGWLDVLEGLHVFTAAGRPPFVCQDAKRCRGNSIRSVKNLIFKSSKVFPKLTEILIRFVLERTVKQRTQTTPEKRVDPFAGVKPSKVEIVEGRVVVEKIQKSGQFRNTAGELVHMNETEIGRLFEIILVAWSQYDRYDVVLQGIQIELFRYIIFAVRVLERRKRSWLKKSKID